jgi:hypothetical protein
MATRTITLLGGGAQRNKVFSSLLKQLGLACDLESLELKVEEAQGWSKDGWHVQCVSWTGPNTE